MAEEQEFLWEINEFLVSKETVVLRRWERSKQKFGFIKRVDKTKFTLKYAFQVWKMELTS